KSNHITLYKYKKIDPNQPLALRQHKDSVAVLAFNFNHHTTKGTWANLKTGNELDVKLKFVSSLKDLSDSDVARNIPILQHLTVNGNYFIGIYEKQKGTDRARMNELKIFQRSSDSLIQTINFDSSRVGF